MDSNFFFPVTVHQNGVTVPNIAQWVAKLPISPPMGTAVVVLNSTEGVQLQGMYLYDTLQFRWRYLIPYSNVCQAIIDGSTLDLYYQVQTPVTLPANTLSWRNGVLYSGTQIDTTPTVAWAVLTMSATGTVDSVNGVNPGAGGNVSIGISDIPGLQTALSNAGSVKSVNSQSPNAGGNITLLAEDNNNATGVSLITDNGATDGTFKFKTLVAGSNVTVSPDTNGNLVIAATGGGAGGVTSVALALPSIFTVTGSPVTSTGTLTGTLVGQASNTVFRGPVSGAPGIPTFGPLVSADLPLATTTTAGAVTVGSGLTVTAGTVSADVISVAGRTGAVTLSVSDVTGAAPLASPALTGDPTAPTATAGTNTTQIATTAFVQAAVSAGSVTSFNTRTGAVTLTAADVTGVGGALLASPTFTGTPSAPTATAGTNSTQIATTAFVATSFAPLASPALTGTPTAPTATAGTNTTQLATTAFVTAAVGGASVTSFNTRTGAVTLTAADVTGVGGALLASPTFTGTPAAPTATAGTSTTQIATTAFVATSYAPLASPVFTGRSTVPADEYTATALGSVSGTVTLDLTLASEWSFTPSAATMVAFSNPPPSGFNQVIYLQITNGGAFTITWPTGTQFAAGTAPTLTASGVDVLGIKYNATAAVYQLYVIGQNVH